MKTIVILFALLVSGCAAYTSMPSQEAIIVTEITVPGMSGRQIFDDSKVWIVRHLYSEQNIIEVADRKAGIIVANGYIDYPATGTLESIDRIQYTISFVMREEIRDSGITLTFRNLELYVPKYYYWRPRFWPTQEYVGGYYVPVQERSDYEAARKGLLKIAHDLGEYLRKETAR